MAYWGGHFLFPGYHKPNLWRLRWRNIVRRSKHCVPWNKYGNYFFWMRHCFYSSVDARNFGCSSVTLEQARIIRGFKIRELRQIGIANPDQPWARFRCNSGQWEWKFINLSPQGLLKGTLPYRELCHVQIFMDRGLLPWCNSIVTVFLRRRVLCERPCRNGKIFTSGQGLLIHAH